MTEVTPAQVPAVATNAVATAAPVALATTPPNKPKRASVIIYVVLIVLIVLIGWFVYKKFVDNQCEDEPKKKKKKQQVVHPEFNLRREIRNIEARQSTLESRLSQNVDLEDE